MPSLPGLQRDVEAQPPVGVHRRLAVAIARTDDHLAAEILVAIGDAQHLPLIRPRRGDAAAPHDLVALDLEDVGEIGADRDLQIEAHRVRLLLVMSISSCSPPSIWRPINEAQCACRDRPVLAHEGAVGQEDARRVIGDGAAVQQVPLFAIRIDRPGADHPGVAEIKPACAGPDHLPVGVGHQHRLTLMDGDLRRADLNLERHVELHFRPSVGATRRLRSSSAVPGQSRPDQHRGERVLIAQYVSDRQEQVTAELVRGFAALIFDSVVTSAISKLPIFEFSIAVLNHFSANLSAEKIIQGPGPGRVAGENYDRTIVFHGTGANRFFNAVAHSC